MPLHSLSVITVIALAALFSGPLSEAGVPAQYSREAPDRVVVSAAPSDPDPGSVFHAPFLAASQTRNSPPPQVWPPPLIYVPLLYVPDDKSVLLVGGQHSDLPWLEPDVWQLRPLAALKLGDGAGPSARRPQRAARKLWTTIGPMVPEYDLVTYDSGAGKVIATVSFLWNSLWEPTSQTWSFDPRLGEWEELGPAESPPPGLCGCGSQAAFDSRAGKTIVFGGIDIVGYFSCLEQGCTDEQWLALDANDTWAYDYGSNRWTKMERPSDESRLPGPRNTHALAYDPDTDRVLLFGGDDGLVSLDDTWIYDYNTNTWTKVETDVHPSARDYAQLVYDPETRRMVLFGGVYYASSEETLCEPETWTFDLVTLRWEKMAPPFTPSARAWHGMTFSESAKAVVLYGGGPLREEATDELWLYSVKKDRWWQVPKQ